MFKSSRVKIVAAIMSILILLFLGTLGIIYGSSYFEVSETNYKMLERYAQLYYIKGQTETMLPDGLQPGDLQPVEPEPPGDDFGNNVPTDRPEGPRFEETPVFMLSTFYSVAISNDGEILAIDNGDRNVYEDEGLKEYALEIAAKGKIKGIKGNLIYITEEKSGYILIAFMDNTVMRESMTTLFRYTLVFGSIAIIALFFVAVYLAKRIVNPLEESYEKQKQFISDAGHELKTPISVVNANAELLSRELGENQWLANIQYENERMGKLVGQLLELARTENVSVQSERLDFSRLAAGEALPFESAAFEEGLGLNCNVTEGLFVEGNSGQLKQLVSILLDNAIRHSKGGKEITMFLKEEHGFAKLSVINAGDALSEKQMEHLFDRFYRIDSARNGESNHYGLGLSIAKAIVTANKGKIQVLCYEGKVEFVVRIPLVN